MLKNNLGNTVAAIIVLSNSEKCVKIAVYRIATIETGCWSELGSSASHYTKQAYLS
jgi:hypothetical protein